MLPVAGASDGGPASIKSGDLKEWLTYIASDDLQGRAVFTTGLGLAAAYIDDHLRAWGVKPAGDSRILSADRPRPRRERPPAIRRSPSRSADETRTFADGDGITFPRNAGGKRRFTIDRVEFAGYGLDAPARNRTTFGGRDVNGAAVIWLGANGPKDVDRQTYRLLLAAAESIRDRRRCTPRRASVLSRRPGGRGAGRAVGQVRRAGWGRRARRGGRARAAVAGARLHDRRSGSTQPVPPNVTAKRRLLRVPLQPRADTVRRAEAQGGRAGAAARRSGSTT